MPIRLRLTLWNCFIFGSLLVVLTSAIYIVHRQAHYSEIDRMLTSVSLHVHEEVERDIRKGKALSEVGLSSGEFYMTGVYIVIKDRAGNKVVATSDAVQAPDSPFSNIASMEKESLHTVVDPALGRYRMLIKPIWLEERVIGYIQSEIALNSIDTSLYRFGWFILGVIILGLIFATLGGWFLSRKALTRVETINQTAKAIAASQGFHQRVMHRGPQDELGELVETFNEMLESLEKAYMSQRRFLADASHELRAPLTTIRGNLDILQKVKTIPQEEQDEILQDIRSEAIRMSKMVGDLLSLARADAGQEIRMQVVDLSKIVKGVELELAAWPARAAVTCSIQEGTKTWGNEDLLKQLFLILMENAIRYTPEGGAVSLTVLEESGNVTIRVVDSGIGIDSKDLPFIFDRFYRSETARSHSPDGTGLGLSIAKWIVDQHNGSILVTSTPGQGTEFEVRLPIIS